MTPFLPVIRLLVRLAVLATPLALVFFEYLILDPFKVVRPHATYYEPTDRLPINRDFVSTEEFMRQERTRPNAFVFGSSRSLVFRCNEWRRYLPPDARPFHFDAWSESVYGVWRKALFLDAEGMDIKDALLIFDTPDFEHSKNDFQHLFIKHPRVSGESAAVFQALHAAVFYKHLLFFKVVDWNVFGTLRPYMLDVFDPYPLQHLPETNDLIFQGYDDELRAGESAYYERHRAAFTKRIPFDAPAILGKAQTAELEEVARIFQKHRTRVRVIVTPLYGQAKLAPADHDELSRLFGKENVFDFSGTNAYTENVHNYYEASHFRPHVAAELMRIAYGAQKSGE